MVSEWVRALDWRPGGPGFESRCVNFASDFGNFVYSALPVSFVRDTKSCQPPLSGVYARGSTQYPVVDSFNIEKDNSLKVNRSCVSHSKCAVWDKKNNKEESSALWP